MSFCSLGQAVHSEMDISTAADITFSVTAMSAVSGGMKLKPETEEPGTLCYWYTITILGLLAIFVSMVGTVANFLTVILMWKQVRKSATIFFVVSLAFLDLVLLLTRGIMSFMTVSGRISLNYALGMELRGYIYAYLLNIHAVVRLSTIWVNVIIMWHRYYAIEVNYSITGLSIKRVALQTLGVLSASVLFNIPRMLQYKLIRNPMGILLLMPTEFSQSLGFKLVYELIAYFLFYYILPMAILIVYTVKSVKMMTRKMKSNQHLKSSIQRREHEISSSLVVVVIIFLLSHSLGPIHRVLQLVFNDWSDVECGGILFYVNPILVLLSNVHAVVDFFVYAVRVSQFRKRFIRMIKCNKNTVSPNASSLQSRNLNNSRLTTQQRTWDA